MQHLAPGTPLQGGKYRIEEALAQSSVAITYLATQVEYNIKVCIKELFIKEFSERPSNTTVVTVLSPGFVLPYRREFLDEALTISRLDHPSIIRIYDRFEENETAYYVMEFVEGPSLADMLEQHGPLKEEKALDYIRQLGEGLQYIHEQGITHLGVQPANVMVRSRDNVPILIDFALSKHYSANGRPAKPQTDIYALAAMLYELLTGNPAPNIAGDSLVTALAMEGISMPVCRAIERGLHSELAQRPESAKDFLHMLGCYPPEPEPAPVAVQPQATDSREIRITAPKAVEPQSASDNLKDVPAEAAAAAPGGAAPEQARNATQAPGAEATKPAAGASAPAAAGKSAAGQSTQALYSTVPKKKPVQQPKPVAIDPAAAEAAKQREKYSQVSQQFAKNMARNQRPDSSGAPWIIALGVLLVLAIVAYFIFG